MKTIYKIAKTELKQMFCSPIAWLILAIFAFQGGIYFAKYFSAQVLVKEIGDSLLPLTERIYTSLFRDMQTYLYLYIPLITMGLLSKEKSSGSIKLLYSSPITNKQITYGKYLAMLIYNLSLVVILLLPVVYGAFFIPNLDLGRIFSAILGLYLLSCAYAAVGLFMSSLTSYQIVAALASLTLLSLLTMAGKLWQNTPFLRDVAYWISMNGRANNMIWGLITSEDVLYFILIAGFFVALTICKLNGEREKKSFKKKALEYVTIVLVVVACGYVTIIPKLRFYADATNTNSNTVSEYTVDALKEVGADITVTTFVNLLDPLYVYGMPDKRVQDKKHFERYARFNKGMKFKYVYYYGPNRNPDLESIYPGTTDQEKMQKVCESLGLKEKMFKTHEQVEAEYGVDLSESDYTMIRLLSTKDGRKSWLRMYNDMSKYPTEEEIAASVKRIGQGPCKIGYVAGHGERSITKFGDREFFVSVNDKTYRKSLINNGFDPVVIDLAQEIPDEIELLVVADPRTAYSEEELAVIKNYIDKGGNAVICSESGHQDAVNPVAEMVGVKFQEGCLMQENEWLEPELVTGVVDTPALDLHRSFRWMRRWGYCLPMGRAAEYQIAEDNGFDVINTFVSDTLKVWNSASMEEKTFPLLSQMKRTVGEKEQHIIVAAETDWLTNAEMMRRRTGVNQDNSIVCNYMFRFLTNDRYPCVTYHPYDKDRSMKDYTAHSATVAAYVVFLVGIPLLLVIICVIINRIRKRK